MGLPIRVLHVVVNMNRGGAETLLMNLYRHMDRNLIQFDFLTFKPGIFDQEIQNLGGRVHRISYLTEVGHFKFQHELRHFFLTHPEYKMVHSHLDKMSGLILKEAHRVNIPIRISHSHNTRSEGGFVSRAYKSMMGSLIFKHATDRMACSELASNWLFKGNKAHLLKNGIDLPAFSFNPSIREKIRAELNIPSHSFVVGHIGRFNEQKNHHFLIDIFSKMLSVNSDLELVLVGEGNLKSMIQEKVKGLKIENQVSFLGLRDDVPKILQVLDIMIFPSLHEGLPLTLVEAQASGLPCLISDSISREVDMGLNLIEYESLSHLPEIWAEKALSMKNKRDENPLFQLKQAGYDIQDSCEWLQEFYLLKDLGNTSNLTEKQGVI